MSTFQYSPSPRHRSGADPSPFSPSQAVVPTICFAVQAAAEPDVMPRVIEFFAQRNLVPTRWHSTAGAAGNEGLQIDIQVAGLEPRLGEYIARCLRRLINVDYVLTSVKGEADTGDGFHS